MLKQLTKTVATAFSSDPLKEFKLSKEPTTPGFRHGLFSVSAGVERATKKEVSVFSTKRKELVLECGGEAQADEMLEHIKRSINLLSQLNHPSLLRFERPLTINGTLIYFVTERIQSFLPYVEMKNYPLQMKRLQLQRMLSAIRFLHERCRIILLNFGPHSIYITSSGWKIGDLCFSLLPTDVPQYRPLERQTASRGPLVPDLDYLADECLSTPPATTNSISAMMPNLFDNPGGPQASPSSPTPHCDTFSFLLTAAEVLLGRRMINCQRDGSERRAQLAQASKDVQSLFPLVVSLSSFPRPELAALSQSSCIFSEDIRVLLEIEKIDVTELKEIPFQILKELYDFIGQKVYATEIISQVVVPFSLRAAKQQRFLRFILPIFLQCAHVLSLEETPQEMKEFFTTVLTGVSAAQNFDSVKLLAQQILEKMSDVEKLFTAPQERAAVLSNFYIKCLVSTDAPIVLLSLKAIKSHLGTLQGSTSSSSAVGMPGLTERLLLLVERGEDTIFTAAVDVLSTAAPLLSEVEKNSLEISLVRCLSGVLSAQRQRCLPLLGIMHKIQGEFPLEHLANSSIPLLSALLLSSSPDVRNYAALVITKSVAKFDVQLATTPSVTASAPPTAVFAVNGGNAAHDKGPITKQPHASPGTTPALPDDLFSGMKSEAVKSTNSGSISFDPVLFQSSTSSNDASSRMWGDLQAQLTSMPSPMEVGSASRSPGSASPLKRSYTDPSPPAVNTNPDQDIMAAFGFA